MSESLFTVVIAGRPNAGKSTLFNRMLGRRHAIVHDSPGVTRDENRAFFEKGGAEYQLIDTGGIESGDVEGSIGRRVEERSLAVLQEADLILYLLDGAGGLAAPDQDVAHRLRRLDTPKVALVNKIDGAARPPAPSSK